jgi:hypothetical protein
MFWRNKRFFKRQYFVAIALFNNLELYKIAKIDFYHPNSHGLYAIRCDAEGGHKHRVFQSELDKNQQTLMPPRTLLCWRYGSRARNPQVRAME